MAAGRSRAISSLPTSARRSFRTLICSARLNPSGSVLPLTRETPDAGDAATAVREKAPMAAPAAPAAAPAAPVDEAAFLAALAPVFSQSLDEALRAAHKRAEVS